MSLNSVLNVFPNRETFENTNVLLARIAGALENQGGGTGGTNFNEIKSNVALGLGEKLYPVGTEFTTYRATGATAAVGADNTGVTAVSVNAETFIENIDTVDPNVRIFEYNGAWYYKNTAVNPTTYGLTLTGTPAAGDKINVEMTCSRMVWRVVGHDHFEAVSGGHTMALEMKNTYANNSSFKGLMFDAAEAFYTHDVNTALAAGTYNFTLESAVSSWAAGTYQFTTTASHPKGAQFCISGANSTALTSLNVVIYDNGYDDTTAAETCSISSGSSGTALGTLGAGLNHAQRVGNGSNNYGQSGLRQFLNSEAVAGSICTQQTTYDRKPNWDSTGSSGVPGFLHGLSKDFKNAMIRAHIPCRTNNVFETPSLDDTTYELGVVYTVTDKVFILSRPEIWGTYENVAVRDGELLPYYDGLTNMERIKYDEWGTAHDVWVRTGLPSSPNTERRLRGSNGSLDVVSAGVSTPGVVAACVIG